MEVARIIAEGKTKTIKKFINDNGIVCIESKDNLTARNGKKNVIIPGKGISANITACNVFRFLNKNGVSTHYLSQIGKKENSISFEAYECLMLPLEVVVRRIADGSYLERNPNSKKGDIFSKLIIEFFYKNDDLGDPLIHIDEEKWELRNPKNNDFISPVEEIFSLELIEYIKNQAKFIFLLLEKAFRNSGIVLWDLKLEFGYNMHDSFNYVSPLILADVIDNDSWRITLDGVNLDKQRFRDGTANRKEILNNYILVQNITCEFVKMADKGNALYNPKIYFISDNEREITEAKAVFQQYGYHNYIKHIVKYFDEDTEIFNEIFTNNFENSIIICGNTLLQPKLSSIIQHLGHSIIFYPKIHNFRRNETGIEEAVKESLKYVAQVNPLIYAKFRMEFEEHL